MRFGTKTSGYRSHEIMRQNTMLASVLLSQETDDNETTAGAMQGAFTKGISIKEYKGKRAWVGIHRIKQIVYPSKLFLEPQYLL